MKLKRSLGCGVAAAVLSLTSTNANAVVINLIDAGGVAGSQAEMGFNIAAKYWETVLVNDAVLNFAVGYSELEEGVIGQTGSSSVAATVTEWKQAVNTTQSSFELDTRVRLPETTSGAISAITNAPALANRGVTTTKEWDADTTGQNSINNKNLAINTTLFKALGGEVNYGPSDPIGIDAEITFSSTFGFDFDPTDGIDGDTFDFIATAIHEMGHALGFVSGVDIYDFYADYAPGLAYNFDRQVIFTPLDMFRYSNDPTNIAPGTGPVLDLASGSNTYFSINRGNSQLFGDSKFSTGTYTGDEQQASHWKDVSGCEDQRGIMDPTECFGQMGEVKALDLAAFDAIGWNLNFDVYNNSGYNLTTAAIYSMFAPPVAVPEASTWAMLIAGFGLVGAAMRRRGVKVSFSA